MHKVKTFIQNIYLQLVQNKIMHFSFANPNYFHVSVVIIFITSQGLGFGRRPDDVELEVLITS